MWLDHVRIPDDPWSCWPWTGAIGTRTGYGNAWVPPRYMNAHKAMYEYMFAVVPPKHHLHHTCENRACVNPYHLEVVTSKEHGQRHKPTHCPHGHEYTEENSYIRKGTVKRMCRACHRASESKRRAARRGAKSSAD